MKIERTVDTFTIGLLMAIACDGFNWTWAKWSAIWLLASSLGMIFDDIRHQRTNTVV